MTTCAFDELHGERDRELEVPAPPARLSSADIAAQLLLGENTIKTHVARMLRKLGPRDRVQAVVAAYETGLVVPDTLPGSERRAEAASHA